MPSDGYAGAGGSDVSSSSKCSLNDARLVVVHLEFESSYCARGLSLGPQYNVSGLRGLRLFTTTLLCLILCYALPVMKNASVCIDSALRLKL